MTRTDGGRELVSNVALVTAAVVMTTLIAIDLVTDVGSGTTAFHAVVEGAVIVIGLVAAVRLAADQQRNRSLLLHHVGRLRPSRS